MFNFNKLYMCLIYYYVLICGLSAKTIKFNFRKDTLQKKYCMEMFKKLIKFISYTNSSQCMEISETVRGTKSVKLRLNSISCCSIKCRLENWRYTSKPNFNDFGFIIS